MGQHLVFYATKKLSPPQLEAWVHCRAKEHTELPTPGFEEDSFNQVQAMIRDKSTPKYECGLTWAIQAYPGLGWSVFECTPEQIATISSLGQKSKQEHEALRVRHPDIDWSTGPLFDWLHAHQGFNILVDHTGI